MTPSRTGADQDDEKRLSVSTLLIFSSTSMPISLLAIGLFMFLPDVYASLGGISMVVAGVVIMGTRVWDFVTDPLVGWLSDRTRTRLGRRVPWMVLAWLPLSIASYKLFIPPAGADEIYLAFWSFVMFASGTALFMPYTAMGAELSDDYHERSRVFLYRHVFAALGTLLAGFLFVVANNQETTYFPQRATLELIAWTGLALLPVPIVFTAWKIREAPSAVRRAENTLGWRASVRLMWSNKPFLQILGAYFANGVANAFPLTLFFFFIRQVLERPEWAPVYLTTYFTMAIAGTPIWLFTAKRFGKHIAWRVALIIAIAAFSIVPFLGSGDTVVFLGVAIVAGLTLGADLAMPASMLADSVDRDVLETGERRTGIYFAVWGMAAKAAAAFVVGVSFEVLAVAGFVPKMYNDADALLALTLLFGVCPILFKLVSLRIIWGYSLTREEQAALQRKLASDAG